MIDDTTINAFGDEMEKIAGGMMGGVGKTLRKWVSTGWNKPMGLYEKAMHEAPAAVAGGKAVKTPLKDAAGKQVWHERPESTWMGQGKVTKYLPVGDKGIVAGLTAAAVPGAVKKEDEEGLGRSRAERVSGLAGSTVGGFLGAGALSHLPMKGLGITRAITGAIGGSMLGGRMATAPFRGARRAELPAQPAPQQQQAPVEGGVA